MSQIESTLKPRDVEEVLDVRFYRPLGYLIARLSRALALTPNSVTVISIIVGMVAGHLFYYTDLAVNVLGMVLLILSEAIDSADGQLARMTSMQSRIGRILDGFGGNLVFISIYFHLSLRIVAAGGPLWIFAVAALSGISHSFQCAMADYYRNAYLHFVFGEDRSEMEQSGRVAEGHRELRWLRNPLKKFLMRIYLNYTLQQELLAGNFLQLYATARSRFGQLIPQWLRQEYSVKNKPLLKYYNLITTNTRIFALFCCLFLRNVYLYFAFEILVLNAVLVILLIHQKHINASLLGQINAHEGTA